ncbi:CPBP family intramembrane glutamic endopeptidase [Vibrio nitrifigilis]|uniref:CPBP family intramembrane metalloprotease n=1 Tax=Vibrio nitrifigilis TaxID=2789781 RepID=A0ABS0GDB0_9VIBR|nr:CPBP family intramembrane glutamic endopeptidase [Vibrio nitrifigilis]MBF9000340.1 CPBP family intramembrane metalloprotease [Vibrio nitrifigilis]
MPLDYSALVWIALALAIVFVFIRKNIAAFISLGITLILAILFSRLTLPTGLVVGVVLVGTWKLSRIAPRYALPSALVVIACCLALFIHKVPGFDNLLVLNQVITGPQSQPFTMYLNLDKPLALFILLLAYPKLLGNGGTPNHKAIALTAIALFCLLPIAVLIGALKFEWSLPAWWWLFAFNNLLFTCVAEEALFRGYLQQKLANKLGVVAGIGIASILFGLAHFAGGPLLVIFAALTGLGYGLIFYWSQRLWVAVLAHFAFNCIHLLCFTYPIALH